MSGWLPIAALCAMFGLAVAAFECAASGHDTAALVCAVALSVGVAGFTAWMVWLVVRAARDTLTGSSDE